MEAFILWDRITLFIYQIPIVLKIVFDINFIFMKPIGSDLNSRIITFYKSNKARKPTLSVASPVRRMTIFNKPSPSMSLHRAEFQNPEEVKTFVRN